MPLRWVQDGPNQWRGLAGEVGDTFATLYQPHGGTAWRVRIEGWPFMPGSFVTLGEARAVAEKARAAQQQTERPTGSHAQHSPSRARAKRAPIAAGFMRATRKRKALDQAERQIREAEERLVRQQSIVSELELQGHLQEAEVAKDLVMTFRLSLEALHAHLRLERRKRRLEP